MFPSYTVLYIVVDIWCTGGIIFGSRRVGSLAACTRFLPLTRIFCFFITPSYVSEQENRHSELDPLFLLIFFSRIAPDPFIIISDTRPTLSTDVRFSYYSGSGDVVKQLVKWGTIRVVNKGDFVGLFF